MALTVYKVFDEMSIRKRKKIDTTIQNLKSDDELHKKMNWSFKNMKYILVSKIISSEQTLPIYN